MIEKRKVGLISVRGLPASYGAFEQTCSQIAEYFEHQKTNIQLYVGCTSEVFEKEYVAKNVVRKNFGRTGGLDTILYGLKTVTWCYKSGCRDLIVFGYALAPFFGIFKYLGMRVICNVDGIEWKRNKWSSLAKLYLKFCEKMVVRSSAELIYDSFNLQRYYNIKHNRQGHLIFYGSEKFDYFKLKERFQSLKVQYQLEENEYYTCVMRLEPENNIKMIVDGFLKSKTSKRLFIIGPSTNYFEKEVLPLIKANKRIIWVGGIYDREALMSIRQFCAAYIHGHKVGGTNPTLVEALHLRNNVFAFNSIFNKELVNGNSLFSTPEELATLLTDKTPEPINLDNEYLYTWEYVCKAYLDLVEKK